VSVINATNWRVSSLAIRVIVEMEEIPQDLIINWDQTAVNYVPISNWTIIPNKSCLFSEAKSSMVTLAELVAFLFTYPIRSNRHWAQCLVNTMHSPFTTSKLQSCLLMWQLLLLSMYWQHLQLHEVSASTLALADPILGPEEEVGLLEFQEVA